MHATLERIARDRRCVALMNMMKRGRDVVLRRSDDRLTWLPTDGSASKTEKPATPKKDNIFTM